MARRLDIIEEKFLNTIKEHNLINSGDKIVIGVSGGPDSITLLTCMNKYKDKLGCEIIVAHVNHLIRKDSTDDEKYVEKICENSQIKFYKKRIEILKLAEEQKKGTEEVGRTERYKFFDEVAKEEGANKIAIAHNMNDNAETMLLNLIRGTGMNGLEGIQPVEYKKYIRPLINCSRDEIEAYCDKYNLKPRIDSTNKQNIYKRNIIRNKFIVELKELNPNIVETLSRTSKIIRAENEYIVKQAKKIFEEIAIYNKNQKELGKIEFEVKNFNTLDEVIKQKIVFITIEKMLGSTRNIEKNNIDDVIKMAQRNIGEKYILLNKNIKVLIKNKKIIFEAIR